MSLSAAVLDAMVQSGCTAEQIAAVVKADLAERDVVLADKRAKDAERQRNHRARNAASRDVTVTECDSVTETPLSPSPKEINSNPHPHTPGNTPRARKADDFPCPVWCDPAVWADLKRNRKTKKLTNTPTAHRQFVAKIEAMADDAWPPGRLVEAIAANGWGGPHDPRNDRNPTNDNRRQGNSNLNAADLARRKLGQGF